MESKTKNSNKKHTFELVRQPEWYKQILDSIIHFCKEYYLYITAVIAFLFFIIIVAHFFSRSPLKTSLDASKKYVIISYNKILYKPDNIKDKTILEAIKAYETGYVEKAKFLFVSAVRKNIPLKEKKIALVNLANIFDDLSQYDLAVKYLKKALEIDKKDGIIYHNLGIVYKHKKDNQQAVESLTLAVKYNKKFVKSYLSLASLYFYLNKIEDALKYYELALALVPDNSEIKHNIAVCLLRLNRTREGLGFLEEIINAPYISDRIKATSCKDLGIYYYLQGDQEKAQFYFNRAAQFVEDYDVYYKLGILYKLQGQYDLALENFSKAYKLNNKSSDTMLNLAELYYRFGDYDRALQYYNYLLTTLKARTEIYLMLGEISYKQDKIHEAVDYYKKALESSPTPDEAKVVYINLGNMYFQLKNRIEALNYYQKALEIDKTDTEIYYNMCMVYMQDNDFENAVKFIDEAIKLNPSDMKMNILKIRILLRSGKYDLAIIEYEKLIEAYPKEILPLFELSNLYYKKQDYDKAEHYLNLALKLNPDADYAGRINLNLALIYSKKKDYTKALAYINKAYHVNKNDPIINYNFGLIYFEQREYIRAMNYFQQVIRLEADDNIKSLAYLCIGNIHFYQQEYKQAEAMYNKALEFNANLTEAHFNLRIIKQRREAS